MIDGRDRIVIGAPGGLALWMFEVICKLAGHNRSGPIEVTVVDRVATISPRALGTIGRVLLSPCPNAQIIDALASLQAPVLYLDDTPQRVVAYLTAMGHTPIEAVRVCSAAYVANPVLRTAPRLAVLSRDTQAPVFDVVLSVCEHLELEIGDGELRDYIDHMMQNEETPNSSVDAAIAAFMKPVSQGKVDTRLDRDLDYLVNSVLEPARAWQHAEPHQAIAWPGQVFYHPERPTEHVPRIIDLTGPARMLSHGPYFYLPPGAYSAEVIIACSDISDDATFRVEMHAGSQCLARVRLGPRTSGAFTGCFSFVHTDVAAEVQAQMIAERGAIYGQLSIVRIAFTRLGAPDAVNNASDLRSRVTPMSA